MVRFSRKDSEVIGLYFRNKILDFMNMINCFQGRKERGTLIDEWVWNQSIPFLGCVRPSFCFNIEKTVLSVLQLIVWVSVDKRRTSWG